MSTAVPHPDVLRLRVQTRLDAFVAEQRRSLRGISPELEPLVDALAELLSGGKRLRAAFCYWGHLGAGGADSDALVSAATALELFQACALIHDDVMDGSDTRRGRPAAHRRFEALHRTQGWLRAPERFGAGAAILLGDLCLGWSDDLLALSGFPAQALRDARPVWADMRTEVTSGQYLDLREQARGGGTVDSALTVVRYKAAKYTVERPLQLGAALAGAGPDVLAACTAYGIPLGEAFQLRDDLLGVFGDPAETGKPAGDDLREGKRTALVAAALEVADAAQTDLLQRHLGDPDLDGPAVDDLRDVLVATGAVARIETMVSERTETALKALQGAAVEPAAHTALEELAVAATVRRA